MEAEAPIHIRSQKLFSAPGSPDNGHVTAANVLLLDSPLDASSCEGWEWQEGEGEGADTTPLATGGVTVLQLGVSSVKSSRISGGITFLQKSPLEPV